MELFLFDKNLTFCFILSSEECDGEEDGGVDDPVHDGGGVCCPPASLL